MAEKSCSVSRKYVETYKGFDIVKETTTYFFYSNFSRRFHKDLIDKREVKYRICKEGDNKKPSKFVAFYGRDTVKEAREQIDKIVNHEKGYLYVTEEEYKRNVRDKDRKNGYGLSYADIRKFIKQYKEGDEKQRFFILKRLENCNFHTIYALIVEGRYEEAEEVAAEDLKLYKDISISVTTKRSMFDMTEKMKEAIMEAVEGAIKKCFNGEIDDILVTEETKR